MGCFESYMEFREEVERIKIDRKRGLKPLDKQRKDSSGDPPSQQERKIS